MNENLLEAWLNLSMAIDQSHIASELPFNEAVIAFYLYSSKQPLTATDLCLKMNMLKSQMNRTLNAMEKNGLIIKKQAEHDKRKNLIYLNEEKKDVFLKQHSLTMKIVDHIAEKYGKDHVNEIVDLLNSVASVVKEVKQ